MDAIVSNRGGGEMNQQSKKWSRFNSAQFFRQDELFATLHCPLAESFRVSQKSSFWRPLIGLGGDFSRESDSSLIFYSQTDRQTHTHTASGHIRQKRAGKIRNVKNWIAWIWHKLISRRPNHLLIIIIEKGTNSDGFSNMQFEPWISTLWLYNTCVICNEFDTNQIKSTLARSFPVVVVAFALINYSVSFKYFPQS